MTILGEVAPSKDSDPWGTSYVGFYSAMIRVPFLGSYFNTIMPVFILVFGLLFAALSALKLKNRVLAAFKKVSQTREEQMLSEEAKKEEKKPLSEYTLIE